MWWIRKTIRMAAKWEMWDLLGSHGHWKFVSFPMKNGGSFQFAMQTFTRGYPQVSPISGCIEISWGDHVVNRKKTPAVDHPGRGIPNSLSTSVGGFFMAVHIGISCGDTAMSWNGKQNTCWLVVYLPLWKMWKSMGRMTSHILWKIKHVWNHQPAWRRNGCFF